MLDVQQQWMHYFSQKSYLARTTGIGSYQFFQLRDAQWFESLISAAASE
jgi:hypothetical protein